MNVLRLPDYQVVIHIIVSEFSANLAKEIESIAKEFDLDESTEHGGRRDYHWSFKSWDDAVAAGELFKHLTQNSNLLLIRVKSNYDSTIRPISHKDLVRPPEKVAR